MKQTINLALILNCVRFLSILYILTKTTLGYINASNATKLKIYISPNKLSRSTQNIRTSQLLNDVQSAIIHLRLLSSLAC